jgi:L-ribulose-5-phosphate 3-epimerase
VLSIGIMQGRLLPPYEGRLQAFPADRWREEFALAREAGLSSIEWIYELHHEANNPVVTDTGIAEIHALGTRYNVAVWSICADYFMQAVPFVDGKLYPERVARLKWLLERAAKLRAWYVVVPFIDQSSVRTSNDRRALRDLLAEVLPHAERYGVEVHLETDLSPEDLGAFLTECAHPLLKINYDIGNSASLGFDPSVELNTLRRWLGSVHVKDRVLGGGTVPLGGGNADFPTCLRLIGDSGYKRPYIMQVARDREGDEVAWAQQNRKFIERHWTW